MTDENNFGRYTQDEVEREIDRAVRQERDRSGKLVIAWAAIAYGLGLIIGTLAL